MTTREIKKCLDQIEKDFPGAEKYISMFETKLFLMRLEEGFEANS